MSLVRAVTVGSLVGAVAAFGIFVAVGPDDLGRAAVPATPTFAPVPTPTVTQLADCTPPAVLAKGVCVTTVPGPKVTATVPASASRTSAPRTTPDPVATDDRDDGEDDGEVDGDDVDAPDDGDDDHDD